MEAASTYVFSTDSTILQLANTPSESATTEQHSSSHYFCWRRRTMNLGPTCVVCRKLMRVKVRDGIYCNSCGLKRSYQKKKRRQSQMARAVMDVSGSIGTSMGTGSYYDGSTGASAMNSLQQMTSMYGDSPMQQQQMGQVSSMYGVGAPLSAAVRPPQPAAKPTAAYPGMSQTHQQYPSTGAPGYPPNAAMPSGYPGQQMRHPEFDQHQGAGAGHMGQYPPNSTPASVRYPTPSGQRQVPQQQTQPTPQPSGPQLYGYMNPNMAAYYSQTPQPSGPQPHGYMDQSASGTMSGSQMMPQYPQGNSHMQRAPGQPPGWPSNYANAQSSDGSYWSQQQQQQPSQTAFQIQHEIAKCEWQISACYQQIADLQSHIHFLRSRMPPNAAQAMAGAATHGSGKPPSDHPHMTPQQYSPAIPPQGGPQMAAQQSAQHSMQRMQASGMQTAANQVQMLPRAQDNADYDRNQANADPDQIYCTSASTAQSPH